MEKTPGLVAVTKFVRPGSAVYASYKSRAGKPTVLTVG